MLFSTAGTSGNQSVEAPGQGVGAFTDVTGESGVCHFPEMQAENVYVWEEECQRDFRTS